MESHQVKIYIYDLSQGMARAMSGPLLGKQLDGIWHTGVVVYGQEIFYGGSGIDRCEPGGTILGQPHKIEVMGETEIPYDVFMDYVIELGRTTFRGECYHLFDHNCNNFSDEISQFLTGKSIPSYITGLPQEVMNSPLGGMLRPFLDAMQVNPGGGVPITDFYHPDNTSPSDESSKNTTEEATATVSMQSAIEFELKPYHESKQVQHEIDTTRSVILGSLESSSEKELFNEMVEYTKQSKPDWGLGRTHIHIIEKILKGSAFNEDQKTAVSGLLQELLLSEDIVAMLVHDPSHTYCCILQLFEQQEPQVQERLAKGLCNFALHDSGMKWLLDSKSPPPADNTNLGIVIPLVRQCLLHPEKQLRATGAALANLITHGKVDDEVAIDLGCAVIDLLQKDTDTETAYNAVVSLCECIASNAEVAAIATISGVEAAKISMKHPSLKQICEQRLHPALSKHSL